MFESPENSSNKSRETNEKPLRENFELEIFDTKINVEKHNVNFNENFVKETGGVTGYTRFKISWSEFSKLEQNVDSLESYRENVKGVYGGNSLRFTIPEKIKKISETLGIPKMMDGHSLVHFYNAVDGIMSFRSQDNAGQRGEEMLANEGFLKQKIFDMSSLTMQLEENDLENEYLDYNYALFDKTTKLPVILSDILPGYTRNASEDLVQHPNIFNGKIFMKILNSSENPELLKDKFNNLIKNSDIFYMGSRSRHKPGLHVDAPGSDSDQGTGMSEDYSYRANTFSFNLNNKGFVNYLKSSERILEEYVNNKEYQLPEKSQSGSPYGGFGRDDFSRYFLQISMQIKEYLNPENWQPMANFSVDKLTGYKNAHPVIPITQSPAIPAMRWCHADRAFLISENGINFIQMKSKEI